MSLVSKIRCLTRDVCSLKKQAPTYIVDSLPEPPKSDTVYFNQEDKTVYVANENGILEPYGGKRYITFLYKGYVGLSTSYNDVPQLVAPHTHYGWNYYYWRLYDASTYTPNNDILYKWWGGSYAPLFLGQLPFALKLKHVSFEMKQLYIGTDPEKNWLDFRIIGMRGKIGNIANDREHLIITPDYHLTKYYVLNNSPIGFWQWDTPDAPVKEPDDIVVFGIYITYETEINGQMQNFQLQTTYEIVDL